MTVFEYNTCNKSRSVYTLSSSCNREKKIKLIYKKMWYLLKNSQAVKKDKALCKMAGIKKSWNTGGSQEMAVMVDQWQKF